MACDYMISTTIKKIWMDKILSGEKTTEYKGDTEFWNKRLTKALNIIRDGGRVDINLLCGQKSYKYNVRMIEYMSGYKTRERHDWVYKKIDNARYFDWWEIHLGDNLDGTE